MTQLHFPWLELSFLIPLCGAAFVARVRTPERAQRLTVLLMGLTLLSTLGAWRDFASLRVYEAHDRWNLLAGIFGEEFPVVDELSAPLLPLVTALFLLTAVATLRTKVRRYSFSASLVALALLLAMFSCRQNGLLVGLLMAAAVLPYLELRKRRRPTRVYVIHMLTMAVLLVVGATIVAWGEGSEPSRAWGAAILLLAIFIRSGVVPLHCWITDLYEHASFGTALLYGTPMVGAYACVRLVLPIAPDWVLHLLGFASLFTAVYASGMALVQNEARRYFCYLLLTHSSLVMLGLEIASPHSFTGALCVWLSVSLALTGFGLTLRSIEARTGRLSLASYHGLYEHVPTLAGFFLLMGLASVGFPGTFGFIGTELLIDGVVQAYPYIGMAVVLVTALSGVAVVKAYFMIFTGAHHATTISLRRRTTERIAVLCLLLLILGGGLFPQPGVASRHHAAMEILAERAATVRQTEHPHAPHLTATAP